VRHPWRVDIHRRFGFGESGATGSPGWDAARRYFRLISEPFEDPGKLSRERVRSWARIAAPLSQHSTPLWQKRHKAHRRRPVSGSVAHVGTTVTITTAPISNSFCSRQIERISLKTAHCIDYSSAKNKSKAHIEIQRVLLSQIGFDDYSSAKNKSKGRNEIQRSALVRLFQRQKLSVD
jgi:hypothetical protein